MAKEEMNTEGFEALSEAVVKQTMGDYENALKILRRNPYNTGAQATVGECELFFCEYVDAWTSIDGKFIIKVIQEKVRNENEKHVIRRESNDAG